MIRVTIELWPFGKESEKRLLATADIGNDGTGSATVGNYVYRLRNKAGAVWKKGTIKGFMRQRFSAWWLVSLVLNDAFQDSSHISVQPGAVPPTVSKDKG